MTQHPLPDLTALTFKVETIEHEVSRLRDQLQSYVPARENDLKLQSIQDTVKRIEADVGKAKEQLLEMNGKLTKQEQESQARDAQQREAQDKLQIRVLWGIVSTVLAVLVGVLIAYLTHLIH